MTSRALTFASALGMSALVALPVEAQVQVETQIGARQIEVGDSTQLQITATASDDNAPQNPRLPPVPGLEISGPSTGSRTQVSIMNGRMVQERGISATWVIRGLKPGTYRVGPPTVDWNGTRHPGGVATLEVVPQGSLPRAPRGPQGFDPFRFFDPFGSGSPFPRGLLGPNDLSTDDELPPVPEEFKVDHAPDPIAFLRATVSPKHPVVGEQVVLRLYVYGARGPYTNSSFVDFTHADFLDYSSNDDSYSNEAVRVPIGDTVYIAYKVREVMLFPLHAGKLTIGPASLTITGPRYRGAVTRSSAPIELDVTEPPLDGRPPGYRIGDVGTLALSAAVDPRKVTAGDSVGVVAKLEGTGSIPTSLRVPEQRGVEWNDPMHTDEVHAQNGTVGGFRAFNYVVKLREPGTVDLGELKVPYWDPKRRAYGIARAKLGNVEVAPNPRAAAAPSASAAPEIAAADPLALKPRRSLAAFTPESAPFTDSARFWYLLFGGPLAVALGGFGLDLGRKLKANRERALSSPERLAQEALKSADIAARGSEIAKTAAAVEKALFLAIEAGTGIRARALLRSDLKASLVAAGVPEATLESTLTVLDACEAARFTGKAGDLPPKELYAKARGLVPELARKRKKP